MAEEQKDPQGDSLDANTAEGGHPEAPSGDANVWEDRYKNLQSAFTKTTQEVEQLRKSREDFDQRDKAWQEKWKEVETVKEKYDRLASAFQPPAEAEPQYTPEQRAELDRLFRATPTYQQFQTLEKDIAERRQREEQSRVVARNEMLNLAGTEVEQEFGLVKTDANGQKDESGKKEFFDFLAQNPHYLAGLQSAPNKEAAKSVLKQAYYAKRYPDLERNATAEGTKIVEGKLDAMEAAASVEKPTRAASTESKELQVKPGDRFKDIWANAAAMAEQQVG